MMRYALLLTGLVLAPKSLGATPLISIDFDRLVAGLQGSLSVNVGDSFDVDVVFTGDGTSTFETLGLDVPFNDFGDVLEWVGPPLAGEMAGRAAEVADAMTGLLIQSGASLSVFFEAPPSGFSDGIGGVVYGSQSGPFDTVFAGADVTLFSLTFLALAPGTSTIGLTPLFGGPELALGGNEIPADLVFGTVTVLGPPTGISEPSVLVLLLGASVAWLATIRRPKPEVSD